MEEEEEEAEIEKEVDEKDKEEERVRLTYERKFLAIKPIFLSTASKILSYNGRSKQHIYCDSPHLLLKAPMWMLRST
jgi:hypothetical protein